MITSEAFVEGLLQGALEAYCKGKRALLLWGINPECLRLLALLREHGIPPEAIAGVVDPGEQAGAGALTFRVYKPSEVPGLSFDVLIVTSDGDKEEALRSFASLDARAPEIVLSGIRHLEFRDEDFERIVLDCLVKSYATGYPSSQIHLYQAIQYLSAKGLQGAVAEFGICKGGTIVFLKKTLEHFGLGSAAVIGFDIFEGFPKRKSPLDLYRHHKCEYRDHETVIEYCRRFEIEVVKGDICETYRVLEGRALMLTFFDTDNYSPAKAALQLCADQTVRGGVIVFDHYTTVPDYLYTIGERIAATEVLTPDKFFNPYGTGLFIKH